MNDVITMSEQRLQVALLAFVMLGAVLGYAIGRVHQIDSQRKQPKQRKAKRSPEQRHTRSHW